MSREFIFCSLFHTHHSLFHTISKLDAPNEHVTSTFNAPLTNCKWNCTSSGGALCVHASGNGNINEDIIVFPAGGAVTFTALCDILSSATGQFVTEFGFNGGSSVTFDLDTSNDNVRDTIALVPAADMRIINTSGAGRKKPGKLNKYNF